MFLIPVADVLGLKCLVCLHSDMNAQLTAEFHYLPFSLAPPHSSQPDDQTALSQHLKDGLCGNETVSDHIVVVSHGGTISCLMRHFAEYGCEQLVAGGGVTPNTAINSFVVCVERYPHPKCVSVRMLMSHDLSHLEARGQC